MINVEKNYVHDIKDFEFVDGIFDLCRAAVEREALLIVVTNQAGIGRGLYTETQFHKLTKWMEDRFLEEKAPLAAVYFCPYHPSHGLGAYKKESFDRKPNPGMLLRARDDFIVDLSSSILIGDKETDIQAAQSAGIGKTVLLGQHTMKSKADMIVTSLVDARARLFPMGD